MLLPINKLIIASNINKNQVLYHNGTARIHVDHVNDKRNDVPTKYIYIREANTVEQINTSTTSRQH